MGNVSLSASQMMAVRGWRQRDRRCLNEQFFSSHEADMKYAWAPVQSLLQPCKVGGESMRPSPPSPAQWRRNVWQTHIHKDTAVVLKVLFFPVGTESRSAFRCFLCKSFVLFLRTADAGAQALEQELQTLRWLNWRIVQNPLTVDKNSYQSICVTHCVLNGIFVFSLSPISKASEGVRCSRDSFCVHHISCIRPCLLQSNMFLSAYWIVLWCCQVLPQSDQPMSVTHWKPADA